MLSLLHKQRSAAAQAAPCRSISRTVEGEAAAAVALPEAPTAAAAAQPHHALQQQDFSAALQLPPSPLSARHVVSPPPW